MSATTSRPRRRRTRWWDAGNASAGIYGTIISASVLAAAHGDTTFVVGTGVFGTLLVYWLAERWSEVIGSHLRGEPFDWAHARRTFLRGWPMVQASYGPLLVLLVARILGASAETAINFALLTTIVVLIVLGTLAGRRACLSRAGVIASAIFNGLLGMALIVLKASLH